MEDTVRTPRPRARRWQHLATLLAVLATAAGSIFVLLAEPGVGAAARTWYVTVDGDDGGTGYYDSPLATIGRAVQRASSGDSIRIGAGTFHESVQVYGKSLHLKGAGIGETVLDGARVVSGFVADSDGRYSAPWFTNFQRTAYDPSVPHVFPDRPEAGWPEQFFLDGVQLAEVTSRSAVGPGTFYHDRGGDRVVIGDDPTGRLVEGSDLSWGLYFNNAHGSSANGLSVNRYATEERHMAAVRAYSNDLSLTDVEVRDNARIGLSIIGDRVDVFRSLAVDNGYMGMHGHRATEVSIRNSQIIGNNREVFDPWHASSGMKITESQGIMFSGNTVSENHGPGFWTDLDVTDTVIKNNYFRDNFRSGVEIELSSGVIVVDNVSTGNGEQGVWVLESSQVDVWHNYLAGNERGVWVLDGPRGDVNDVTIGNNVLADPSSANMLVAVDDWTQDRNANMMNVSLDGNRYWTSGSATGLLRWSNWPASLTINRTLEQIRSHHGHEAHGQAAVGGVNPFTTAQFAGAPVPARVQAVRTTSASTTVPSTTTAPTTTAPSPTTTAPTNPGPTTTTPTTVPATTAPTTTAPTTTVPVTTTTQPPQRFDRGGWTSPGVVRGDSRPVRMGSRSAGASPVAGGQLVAEAVAEVGTDPVDAGWRSFAEELATLLGLGR